MKETERPSDQNQPFLTRRERRKGDGEQGNLNTKGVTGGQVASIRRRQMRRTHQSGRR